MSGKFAQYVTHRHPDRVLGQILVSGCPAGPIDLPARARRRLVRPRRRRRPTRRRQPQLRHPAHPRARSRGHRPRRRPRRRLGATRDHRPHRHRRLRRPGRRSQRRPWSSAEQGTGCSRRTPYGTESSPRSPAPDSRSSTADTKSPLRPPPSSPTHHRIHRRVPLRRLHPDHADLSEAPAQGFSRRRPRSALAQTTLVGIGIAILVGTAIEPVTWGRRGRLPLIAAAVSFFNLLSSISLIITGAGTRPTSLGRRAVAAADTPHWGPRYAHNRSSKSVAYRGHAPIAWSLPRIPTCRVVRARGTVRGMTRLGISVGSEAHAAPRVRGADVDRNVDVDVGRKPRASQWAAHPGVIWTR